jgi:hypothetical protein
VNVQYEDSMYIEEIVALSLLSIVIFDSVAITIYGRRKSIFLLQLRSNAFLYIIHLTEFAGVLGRFPWRLIIVGQNFSPHYSSRNLATQSSHSSNLTIPMPSTSSSILRVASLKHPKPSQILLLFPDPIILRSMNDHH